MTFEYGDDVLSRLRILFYGLLAGPLLAFFFLLLQESKGVLQVYVSIEANSMLIRWVMAVLLIGMTITAYLLYNRSLGTVREQDNLREKLNLYLQVNIRKFLLLELACVIAIMAYFITLDPIFKGLYVLTMVTMAMSNPGLYSMLKDIKANGEEAIILKKNLPIP